MTLDLLAVRVRPLIRVPTAFLAFPSTDVWGVCVSGAGLWFPLVERWLAKWDTLGRGPVDGLPRPVPVRPPAQSRETSGQPRGGRGERRPNGDEGGCAPPGRMGGPSAGRGGAPGPFPSVPQGVVGGQSAGRSARTGGVWPSVRGGRAELGGGAPGQKGRGLRGAGVGVGALSFAPRLRGRSGAQVTVR